LEKGKTTNIYLKKKNAAQNFEISFSGDNVELSKIYNAYSQAFDIMKYFSIDPEFSKTFEEYRQILEQEYASLKKTLASMKDSQWRSYYSGLAEGMYKWTKIRIIMDESFEKNKPFKDSPEYKELLSSIDPNDDVSFKSNLSTAWLGDDAS
ncbi:MAG: hypothetical protein P8Y49_07910, partial [Sulfurovaceae bacterium]